MERKQYAYDKLPKLLAILKGWHNNGIFDWDGNSYIKGVNDAAAEALLGKILGKVNVEAFPLMVDASNNADKHYTVPHDELDGQLRSEWEGISWGWQDCIHKISDCLPDIPESIYKDTRK
jgi:hypothetical protein